MTRLGAHSASEEVLERWRQLIDRSSASVTDPAELFAVGTRISGRLGRTHPDIAGFLAGAGLDVLDIPTGLAPRALRDIRAGQAAGRFPVPDAEIALSAAAGGMLGLLRMSQRHPERINEATVDQLTEADLRPLGVPAEEPDASPPGRCLPLTRGNARDNTADRVPASNPGWPRSAGVTPQYRAAGVSRFLADYSGLTWKAYELDLRQYASWCQPDQLRPSTRSSTAIGPSPGSRC